MSSRTARRTRADSQAAGRGLAAEFGSRSAIARQAVAVFCAAIRDRSAPLAEKSYESWRALWAEIHGGNLQRESGLGQSLAAVYRIAEDRPCADQLLFACHTYYATLIKLCVPELETEDALFDWPMTAQSPPLRGICDLLEKRVALSGVWQVARDCSHAEDVFKALYESLLPAAARRALGEFYTPDWLAEHLLNELQFTGALGQRLIDPACGSGTFLIGALRRIRARAKDRWHAGNPDLLQEVLHSVVGIDRNPLAVLAARANYLLAIHDLTKETQTPNIPVFCGDSILQTGLPAEISSRSFDFVAGNPPWQVWDHLPAAYRAATLPLWQHYGLFTLSGTAARHGGGKKDLSMLMLYAAADRLLKAGGKLGFVINQTVLQTRAGEGFRRFQIGNESHLSVLGVHDMVRLQPFAGAANWTSTLVLQKGAPTQFPVPYTCWSRSVERSAAPADGSNFLHERCLAEPVDPSRPNSPWSIRPQAEAGEVRRSRGRSDYTAHLGANTGGANGVYWVRLIDRQNDLAVLENLADEGKSRLEKIRFQAEAALVYPLIRWRDVARYRAVPSAHILLVQDAIERRGIAAERLAAEYPQARKYFERFKPMLTARAAYRRYQAGGPFWSMYNVGSYTLAPVKVVWRRMDRWISAAVVLASSDPLLGVRPVIPQETCVLIDAATEDEAHYLCALLNSAPIDTLVRAHSVRGGKGFGTPGMLEHLALGKFDPLDRRHARLATLSRQAHRAAAGLAAAALPPIQADIDAEARALLGRGG